MQENNHFGQFEQNKSTETQRIKKQNHQNQKSDEKKHLFAFWQTTSYLCKIFVFYQGTFFHVYKAVFCWKHYKNSVFSRAQLLGITDSKTPFRGKTQNGTFATKSAILGFPLVPAETPIFVVFGDFEWAPKKYRFPKTDSCNENARFFWPSEHK